MALSKIDIENMVTGETPVANGGTGQSTLAAAGLQRPNAKPLIINGDMMVAQRGTSTASITGSDVFVVDNPISRKKDFAPPSSLVSFTDDAINLDVSNLKFSFSGITVELVSVVKELSEPDGLVPLVVLTLEVSLVSGNSIAPIVVFNNSKSISIVISKYF